MQTLKKIKTKCLLRIVVEVGNERWALGFLRQGKYCVCVCVCAHACVPVRFSVGLSVPLSLPLCVPFCGSIKLFLLDSVSLA